MLNQPRADRDQRDAGAIRAMVMKLHRCWLADRAVPVARHGRAGMLMVERGEVALHDAVVTTVGNGKPPPGSGLRAGRDFELPGGLRLDQRISRTRRTPAAVLDCRRIPSCGGQHGMEGALDWTYAVGRALAWNARYPRRRGGLEAGKLSGPESPRIGWRYG